MRIRSLRLEQFKKFDQPILVKGFADGLNLIAGPNEMGKSTLLLALRAALFERHGSKAQSIKDLQPNHVKGAAPSVTVEIEIDKRIYRIEKRFLRRPMARLVRPDGQVIEGNDAEAEIKQLLHLAADEKISLDQGSPGHFGVMLIPQTESFRQPSLAPGTRHSLQEAITAEIEQLGNQSEVDSLLANVDAAMFEIVDKRGKPKGRYQDILSRLLEIDRDIEDLRRDRGELADDLAALNRAEAELQDLGTADRDQNWLLLLEDLEAQRTDQMRRKETEARRLTARHRLENLVASRDRRQKLRDERQALLAQRSVLIDEEALINTRLTAAEQEVLDHEQRLPRLNERREALGRTRRRLEQLGDQLSRALQVDSALGAMATDVTLDLDSSALDQVRLNNQPVDRAADVVQVIEGLDIRIENIGRIRIEPKVELMQDLLEDRGTIKGAIDDLMAALDLTSTEPEAIEVLWQETLEASAGLDGERQELEAALSVQRESTAEMRASVHGAAAKRQQIDERLADLAQQLGDQGTDREPGDLDLTAEIADAQAALQALNTAADGSTTSAANDKPLDQLEAEIKDLRQRIETRSRHHAEARLTIERLSTKVAMRAGRGLDERLEESLRRREILSREQAAFQLDTKALGLLKSTLTEAANDAKAAFHAPLAARLTPYVQALLPNAAPAVTPEFGITALNRGGAVDERFEQLSDGTQEQIAILARLAFADMLREQGLPALVVLDDALVFSDDQRLARVFALLEKAAATLQVIILTCREDRFAGLKAQRLRIEQLEEAAAPAEKTAAASAV